MSERELVGMVVPTVDNSFFANLAYYAERFLYDEGYAMLLCSSANSAEKEKTYLRTLAQTGVKGILCVSGLSAVESGRRRNIFWIRGAKTSFSCPATSRRSTRAPACSDMSRR